MKQNVGDLDAHIRIAGGLFMMGYGIMKTSKLMVFIGSMAVAEGVTRFCPMLHMMNTTSHDLGVKMAEMEIPKPR